MHQYQGIIKRYRTSMPKIPDLAIITLQEGNTPLILLENIIKELKLQVSWYVKYEGANPTGSFKDRGLTTAISKVKADGSQAVICASTGNTSAATSAYAAKAKLKCFIAYPVGKVASGKLAQSIVHGAKLLPIRSNYDTTLDLVKKLAQQLPITIVNSINPYRIDGQKTAAFEIVDVLGNAPDYHCLPVGNGANFYAYWLGYKEFHKHGKCTKLPKMLGIQASGAAPFLTGKVIAQPETIATAIRIGDPQYMQQAQATQQESNGWFAAVTDAQILEAQRLLAQKEGLFAEPAAAASIAGVLQALQQKLIPTGSTIVSTVTGHGLKDPDIVFKSQSNELPEYEPDLQQLYDLLSREI